MTLDLLPLLSAFAIITIAELGDKTQIAIVSLSARHRPKLVFIGALSAFALVDGVSALVGGVLVPFISQFWISLAAGILFLTFGVITLYSNEDNVIKIKEHSNTVTTTFFLIAVMELGDKTQIAVIALSAEYGAPIQVFLGVMLAFTLLTALGAVFGKAISKYVSAHYIRIGASLIFIAFGVLFLLEVFSGLNLL